MSVSWPFVYASSVRSVTNGKPLFRCDLGLRAVARAALSFHGWRHCGCLRSFARTKPRGRHKKKGPKFENLGASRLFCVE
jgi:hypothetical protein